ncbi:MAG: 3-isopropylmalate dehydratase large subunit [Gammaproteobacteria bacterium]|nr:3-isopropylmalate dehydratase large subunit [Gammaproteobacteria bacterium]
MAAKTAQTLLDKVWASHTVVPESAAQPAVLYIDLHLVHEVTSPQAFALLEERNLKVRRPDRTLATCDHSTPTDPELLRGLATATTPAALQVRKLQENCARHGIRLHGLGDANRGIVHVIGPELGATLPGSTIVCGDSHTSTHGAFGALAFGIGTTEVGHVLATQTLLQRKPKTLAVEVSGRLAAGVSAKDLVLAIIARLGVGGATGHVIEYRGEAIRALSMEQRMTLCNMSIEAGARAGMIAPDDTTFDYLRGRPMAPAGDDWEKAVAGWRRLASDDGARFDRTLQLDAQALEPMMTWGTNPGMATTITGRTPVDTDSAERDALRYMGLEAGSELRGQPIDKVFIGSCTNARLSDLRDAAQILRGRSVAAGVSMLVVPGSEQVRREAEREGLHEVFIGAGAQWRESGCSMCIAMNGDRAGVGEFVVSTSNRNFAGRQGPGARTLLASPQSAAAAAVAGCISDPREYLESA